MNNKNGLRESVEIKLTKLFDQTFYENHEELQSLLKIFKLEKSDLKKAVFSYTLDIGDSEHKNEKYRELAMRLALHFHNLVKGTYHLVRHETVREYLEISASKKVIDIGYGVPGPYMFDYLALNPDTKFVLADQDKNAERFSKALIDTLHPELSPNFSYLLHDMNTFNPPSGYDTYVMLDSIEHCKDPTKYLHKLVKVAPNANFIFSIPICSVGNLEGFHFYEWTSTQDADEWLQGAGLDIKEKKLIPVNPDVDYFAEFIEGGFLNYFVLCSKVK